MKEKIVEIPIKECVHYCGFKYGGVSYNPYETYIIGLANNENIITLRRQFIQFLMYYRPHNCAEALNIKLSRNIAMWTYPWDKISKESFFDTNRYWFNDLSSIEDLLTHFSEKGILSYRIDEEFSWLERAFFLIRNQGFSSNLYVTALQMKKKDGNAYLLLDGNHRTSALTALGYDSVPAKINKIIYEKDIDDWFAIREGILPKEDAFSIFKAYFKTNTNYLVGKSSAKIIAPNGWMDLYGLKYDKQDKASSDIM
jgi:hypothetical protein